MEGDKPGRQARGQAVARWDISSLDEVRDSRVQQDSLEYDSV